MKTLVVGSAVFWGAVILVTLGATIVSGCAMRPAAIENQMKRCEKHGLLPVVVVRKDGVRRVNCLPEDSTIIVERELKLIKLPTLPGRD